MLFNVPQYIDVEDKIAGPFTAKQLFWMFGMGAVLLILWKFLEKTEFYISAVPVVFIFVALAFYRPYNQPLIKFIFFSIWFLFRPKLYFWNREASHKNSSPAKKEIVPEKKEKIISAEEVGAFAQVLDSRGKESNSKVLEYIKERQGRKK